MTTKPDIVKHIVTENLLSYSNENIFVDMFDSISKGNSTENETWQEIINFLCKKYIHLHNDFTNKQRYSGLLVAAAAGLMKIKSTLISEKILKINGCLICNIN